MKTRKLYWLDRIAMAPSADFARRTPLPVLIAWVDVSIQNQNMTNCGLKTLNG